MGGRGEEVVIVIGWGVRVLELEMVWGKLGGFVGFLRVGEGRRKERK